MQKKNSTHITENILTEIKFSSAEIQITGLQKYKIQKYQNTNYRYAERQITEIQTIQSQKYRNIKYRNTDIQIKEGQKKNITGLQKYKLNKKSTIIENSPIIHLLNMNYV